MGLGSGARVAVAGAGAIGSAVALTLAQAGLQVTVFDAATAGDNASGVAAGMLAPDSEAVFDPPAANHIELLRAARDLWPAFAAKFGLPLHRDGVLVNGDSQWLQEVEARFIALRLPIRRMTPGGPLFSDEDWRIDPKPALAMMRDAAEKLGARFVPTAVAAYETGVLRLADGDKQPFDALVLATGAARARSGLAPELALLTPIKGQILRAATGPRDGPVIRGQGVYICPGPRPAIGATMEEGRNDRDIDPSKTAPLKTAAARLWPRLADTPMSIETGVRAATADGLPLVGWSVAEGMLLAVGTRRNGWLLAPMVAQMATAYLTDTNPGPYAALLDARRFAGPGGG
jgi:glycine oxidase